MDDGKPRFERRVVTLEAGRERRYDAAEWRDALVVVERGELELESSAGCSRRFAAGDLLWLAGLPLRALHNPGPEPVSMVAIARRR